MLNLTEPCSTGIGGDCFVLFFEAKTKKVHGLNGTGRCPSALSIEKLHQLLPEQHPDWNKDSEELSKFSPHTVTVPGAAAAWLDTVQRFGSGRLSIGEVLAPAIEHAERGVPIGPIAAHYWANGEPQLRGGGPNFGELLVDGTHPPREGEVFRNPTLANTFKELVTKGKSGFYEGRIAEEIVNSVRALGGLLSLEDLRSHESTIDDPIHVNYKGYEVYEMPPNGQGITALIALNLLEGFDLKTLAGEGQHFSNSAEALHLLIEALRLAFADTRWYVADPRKVTVPISELLSKSYAEKRRASIDPKKANPSVTFGSPFVSSDTVYFCVQDSEGNACSFINSNYMGFGTGIIPKGCGFTLQNRGHNFSLNPKHPNALSPGKRPYHTIIPGMVLKDGELWASFGVMGGFMQPQGHVQVLVNMIDFGMNPQQALDAPRFCIEPQVSLTTGELLPIPIGLEEGISEEVVDKLRGMGHLVTPLRGYQRSLFGRGQIIRRDPKTGVMTAGSDPRADGQAIGY
jgi:gamma-glutamyltranspeptidase/glutathione hydrolase